MAFVRQLLGLPETVLPFAMLPIGYPLQSKPPDSRYQEDRVFYERYGRRMR